MSKRIIIAILLLILCTGCVTLTGDNQVVTPVVTVEASTVEAIGFLTLAYLFMFVL